MKRNSTTHGLKMTRDRSGRFVSGPAPLESRKEFPAKPMRAKTANRTTDKSVGLDRQECRSFSAIILVLRNIFPVKTDLELALRTGVSQRSAERWLSGANVMTAESLADLLRSDIGGELLGALMEGSTAPWWRDFRRHLDVARLAKSHADTGRKLARILAGETGEG
jgi:hypothetical protein